MALDNVNRYGESFEFGVQSADAPVVSGMAVRSIDLMREARVFSEAKDGLGHTNTVVTSKPNYRSVTATIRGYIDNIANYRTANKSFTFRGQKYIIRRIAEPRVSGEYVLGEMEGVYHPGVSSTETVLTT